MFTTLMTNSSIIYAKADYDFPPLLPSAKKAPTKPDSARYCAIRMLSASDVLGGLIRDRHKYGSSAPPMLFQ